MKKPISLFIVSMVLLSATGSIAIVGRYPGLINIKLPGTEILIDGRSIQTPTMETKLLNRE